MKKLILVRHGESEWNKMNLFTGWTDVDLTPFGQCEAYMAGRLLKEEGYHPTMCYTSYLKRAVKTLNQILDAMDMDYLPVEKSWRLNEKSYGALQGANKAETLKKYGEEKLMQWRRSYDVQPPALEVTDKRSPLNDPRYAGVDPKELPATEALCDTIARLMPYYEGVILKAFETNDEVMVVAHGNSLRGIVKTLKHMGDKEIVGFNIPTAVPYIFEFDDQMNLQKDFYLGNQEEIQKKIDGVKNQANRK